MSPLPQRPVGRCRDAVKWCGGERLGCELSRVGKNGRGGQQCPLYRGSARCGHKEGLGSLPSHV
jgi:hypothetical protein